MRTDDDHQLLRLLPAVGPGKLRHTRRLSMLIGEIGSLGYEVTRGATALSRGRSVLDCVSCQLRDLSQRVP